MANLREKSKLNYNDNNNVASLEELTVGSFQRIADATEKMASNYIKMENDLKWYKDKYQQQKDEIEHLCKRISGFKGYIKRLKNKL